MIRHLLLLCAFLFPLAAASVEVRHFTDPLQQRRYDNLVDELRCLVCQNQSLADSDAELAKDLRDEVYNIIQSGKSEDEAVKFLTDRYGDFVLYRPPFKPITLLLWSGPALILAAVGWFLWRQGRPKAGVARLELSDEERQRLERLKRNLEG
jgi:cytochrome c-type biogenesis protein CcmH